MELVLLVNLGAIPGQAEAHNERPIEAGVLILT